MSTSRHPSYTANRALERDHWITSTMAAQLLGVTLPVFDTKYREHLTEIPRTERRGPRFHYREVYEMRCALDRMGAELFFAQQEDPIRPARAVVYGCLLGAALVTIVGLNVWWWVVRP